MEQSLEMDTQMALVETYIFKGKILYIMYNFCVD